MQPINLAVLLCGLMYFGPTASVFHHYPNKIAENEKKVLVALSRLGKGMEWPLYFQSSEFEQERNDYIEGRWTYELSHTQAKPSLSRF